MSFLASQDKYVRGAFVIILYSVSIGCMDKNFKIGHNLKYHKK